MSATDSIVNPGTILAERYKLTEEIGRGGFGMVYRARQLNMDRDVAIKILPPKFMAVSDVVERFRREARLASRLRHPNTITVHDYGSHENLLFIVMELLDGQDLADVLVKQPTLSMERILHIGRQVLKSLNEAHSHQIVHRDLKPENIFLTRVGGEEDFVKVLDFGIAKLAMPDAEQAGPGRKLTMSGSTVGTPTYMSPEQAAGEEVDPLSDLYALAVILYETACGKPPFHGDNPVKVMRSHLFDEVPQFKKEPLRNSRFESVLLKALAKDKAQRYASAQQFLNALEGSPAEMLRPLQFDDEPPTTEFLGLDVPPREQPRDSGDLGFANTADYPVEPSDALTTGPRQTTESMLDALDANLAGEDSEAIPFESLPPSHPRDRVHEGASGSSLNNISGLSDVSGLSDFDAGPDPVHLPPRGFDSGASTSSIITVMEPESDEVVLLTKKKTPTPTRSPAAISPADDELEGEVEEFSEDSDWSWGAESSASSIDAPAPRPRKPRLGLWLLGAIVAVAAILGLLQMMGVIRIF
jgi:serine/threonine protein kinase